MNKNIFFGIMGLLLFLNIALFYKSNLLKKEIIENGYYKYEVEKKAKEYKALKNRFVCKNRVVQIKELKNVLNSNIEIQNLIITKNKAQFRCEK